MEIIAEDVPMFTLSNAGDESLCILKPYLTGPRGVEKTFLMREMLKHEGFKLVATARTVLQPHTLAELYGKMPPLLWAATLAHFQDELCEVIIVRSKGGNAIKKLCRLVGTETNPNKCEEGTVRRRFAAWDLPVRVGNEGEDGYYYPNSMHRPKDKEELAKDFAALNYLFGWPRPR